MTAVDPTVKRAAQLIESISKGRKGNKLQVRFADTRANGHKGGPYDWQVEFFNAGFANRERCLQAANGIGKTDYVLAPELAIHATGRYPQWWRGRRYQKPVDIVVGSETNEMSRDVVQRSLLGPLGEWGTGWIPDRDLDHETITIRQCSVSQTVDSCRVRHMTGGFSTISFKTYEQGRQKWQGIRKDIIALDEQPPGDIWTEALSRGLARDWMMILTYTPLLGHDDVTSHFATDSPGVFMLNAGWDDAPHLTKEQKDQILAAYPEHERDARSKGVPMLGHGAIYPLRDELITIEPFRIPPFYRWIVGMDFGFDHPTAAVWLAWNAESGMIYVVDCYKQRGETPVYHAQALKRHGDWIPVAWPHDGLKTDMSSGNRLKDHYRELGVNMLPDTARYQDDKGGTQKREPIIQLIYEGMRAGNFKVFSTCYDWFSERRVYHRDERGKIVLRNDDLMAATEYAMMMLRRSRSRAQADRTRQMHAPDWDPFEVVS